MKLSNKVILSGAIGVCSLGLWAAVLFTNEQLLLDSAIIQMVVWLIIGAVQVVIAAYTPKYWKVVPITGAVLAAMLAVLYWLTAGLLG